MRIKLIEPYRAYEYDDGLHKLILLADPSAEADVNMRPGYSVQIGIFDLPPGIANAFLNTGHFEEILD